MIKPQHLLLAACFVCVTTVPVFAEAPVVDDSQNFALLDEQQSAYRQPVTKSNAHDTYHDDETPLASDDAETSNTYHGNGSTLLNKIQGLQQDIQELRGQLEVQAHDLKLLQQQQLAFYKDLDARLRQEPSHALKQEPSTELALGQKALINPPTAPVAPVTPVTIIAPGVPHTNPADEQISYLAAYELIKNKKFDDALIAMQQFVIQHPQGGYTANAQYWLGELYLVKKNYPESIAHFEVVLQQFPSSSKAAPSLLKIGYAFAASGNKEEAIARLQQVLKNYPDTNTAQLAKAKLESLSH